MAAMGADVRNLAPHGEPALRSPRVWLGCRPTFAAAVLAALGGFRSPRHVDGPQQGQRPMWWMSVKMVGTWIFEHSRTEAPASRDYRFRAAAECSETVFAPRAPGCAPASIIRRPRRKTSRPNSPEGARTAMKLMPRKGRAAVPAVVRTAWRRLQ